MCLSICVYLCSSLLLMLADTDMLYPLKNNCNIDIVNGCAIRNTAVSNISFMV